MHEVYDFQTTPNTVSVMFTFIVAVDDEADPTNRNQKAGLVYIQDGVEDQNKIDKDDLEGMQTVEQLRKHIADRLELETSCVELMLESGYKLYDGSELGEVGLKIELVATCKTKCNIIFTALGAMVCQHTHASHNWLSTQRR